MTKRGNKRTGGRPRRVEMDGKSSIPSGTVEILLLINAFYYRLNTTLIVPAGDMFRLIIITNNGDKLWYDYNSIKGAKIAFQKFYGYRLLNISTDQRMTSEWRKIHADVNWLRKKTEGVG